jgi:hypothetical protein
MKPSSLVRSIGLAIGIAAFFQPVTAFAGHPRGDGTGPGYCSTHGG